MEWSNEKVIAFLEVLQTEPCLWNLKLKSFKNRSSQNDAWRRIMQLLPFKTTTEQMKKKKESLMGYYRIHLNKFKKSLESGVAKDDVYTTSWFAFETMDSFLREVYDNNRTLNIEINDSSESQEKSEGENDANENSIHLFSKTEEGSQNIQKENRTRKRESKSFQDCARKRPPRNDDEMPPEIRGAQRKIDEDFEYTKEEKGDECEIFGRLIASKIKKIRNPNTRDILMNDIQNLVFRTCMADRLQQEPAVPQVSTFLSPDHQVYIASPNPLSCQSPPGASTFMSVDHKVFIPSPNSSSSYSLPGPVRLLSPHH